MGFGGVGSNFRGGQGFTRSHLSLPSGSPSNSPQERSDAPVTNEDRLRAALKEIHIEAASIEGAAAYRICGIAKAALNNTAP